MSGQVMQSEKGWGMGKSPQPGKAKESALQKELELVAVGRYFPSDAAAHSRRRFLLQRFHNAFAVSPNPADPTMNPPFR
jgi:hypothetical protein